MLITKKKDEMKGRRIEKRVIPFVGSLLCSYWVMSRIMEREKARLSIEHAVYVCIRLFLNHAPVEKWKRTRFIQILSQELFFFLHSDAKVCPLHIQMKRRYTVLTGKRVPVKPQRKPLYLYFFLNKFPFFLIKLQRTEKRKKRRSTSVKARRFICWTVILKYCYKRQKKKTILLQSGRRVFVLFAGSSRRTLADPFTASKCLCWLK